MRINRYLAAHTGISRREADEAIKDGRVGIGGRAAVLGEEINEDTAVTLDGETVLKRERSYVLMNKPVGYVTSRRKQGQSPTIYDLLPPELHHLKPVGRLDKDSCGLLLLTDDGELTQQLTHPSQGKLKTYRVRLDRPITDTKLELLRQGVDLEDGLSRMGVERRGSELEVTLGEGRNRQIRRSFDALGYKVKYLERTAIGELTAELKPGELKELTREQVL